MNTTTMSKPSLTLKRRIKASPEKVYAAFTDPVVMRQWWGPSADYKILLAEADVRVGGRFRVIMQDPSGEKDDVSGTYKEVVENEKLVFSWAWITTPERESLVTVTITKTDDGSMLMLYHSQFFDEAARDGHNEGWSGALDKLEALFATP